MLKTLYEMPFGISPIRANEYVPQADGGVEEKIFLVTFGPNRVRLNENIFAFR